MTNKASDSLYFAKKAIKLASETTFDQGMEYESTLIQFLFGRKASKEGITAFIEKRKPNFKNLWFRAQLSFNEFVVILDWTLILILINDYSVQ